MLAMIGLGVLGLREFFRMTDRARPVMLPAYLAVAAMVIAAHYGTSFQILLALAASFPLIFVFAAARGVPRPRHHLDRRSRCWGSSGSGIGLSHAMLLRDLPDHGGRAAGRRARRDLHRRHRGLRRRPPVRLAQDHPADLARTRRSRA